MPTKSASLKRPRSVLRSIAWSRWALWLLLATGCGRTSLEEPRTNSSVNVGSSEGGASGQAGRGNAAGTEGLVGSGGVTGSGGSLGFGGSLGSDGLSGSGGRLLTGGVGGGGGMLGTGGMAPDGGTPAVGGAAGAASTAVFGMSCTTNADCPGGSTCCDGSNESCDGTRLPSGDATNPGEFVVSTDGLTVTDTVTGLVWQQDGSGTRSGCSGRVQGYGSGEQSCTQTEAAAYCSSLSLGGFSDWRLPARHELETIVDLTQAKTSIDSAVFANTLDNLYYWTSSPYAMSSGSAWALDFEFGYSYDAPIGNFELARCVRGSRCYPTSRFVSSNGVVTDTLTGLIWQQQASATDMTWSDAQSYCSTAGSGFRLPVPKELESLADLAATSAPSISQTAFPNTPADFYWTSSQLAGQPGVVWLVSFGDGSSGDTSLGGTDYRVRCVR